MEPMNLIGQFLIVSIALGEVYSEILGIPGNTDTTEALIGGEITGITPQLGLWVTLTTIRCGNTEFLMNWPGGPRPPQLVRWELIRNGTLFPAPPTTEQWVGFRPPQK